KKKKKRGEERISRPRVVLARLPSLPAGRLRTVACVRSPPSGRPQPRPLFLSLFLSSLPVGRLRAIAARGLGRFFSRARTRAGRQIKATLLPFSFF
ncbi:hypothetical protein GW17_00012639, partial [Ensete ventricosum]